MRRLRTALYLYVARWLPASTMPGGRLWRRLRSSIARPLFAECGEDVNIERGAYFGSGAHVILGSRSGVGINCELHGPVRIGQDVMMGPNVAIYALSHNFGRVDRPMIEQGFAPPSPVVIGDDVWIGRGTTILPGVRIGSHSIIGAASVVTHDVPPYMVVAGNPAREIRDRRSTPRTAS